MTNERWNELQNEVFSNTFSMNKGGSSLKKSLDLLKSRVDIWKNFYGMIGQELDPSDKMFDILDIKIVNYNNGKYLCIKVSLWYYVIIDLEKKKTLTDEEIRLIFNGEFFKEKFHEMDVAFDYYSFDSLSDEVTSKIIDYFIEYENVLTDKKNIRLTILDNEEVFGYLVIYFDKEDVMVGINGKKEGRCNYIFLNKDLKVYGASNLTGNKEDVASYFDGNKDIMIPEYLLNKYINYGIGLSDNNGNSFGFNKQV